MRVQVLTQLVTRAPLFQMDQNMSAPWYVPALLGLGAFVITFLRSETALALIIFATALDRYRFDFAGAGLRIEHFVVIGVALAWGIKTRPTFQQLHFSRADLLLAAYLGLALGSSLFFAPLLGESLKFFGLMVFGVVLYWLVRAIAGTPREFRRGVWTMVVVGIGASLFGIAAWLVYPLGLNLGVQIYSLENFVTYSPYGTLFDSNTLGMYAMAATLLQVTLLLDAQFARWRVWLGIGIVISLLAVALSLTRTAWIGLIVGLCLVLLFSPRRRWALAIVGAAVVLIIAALVVNSALAGGQSALAEFSVARVLTSRSIFFRLDAYARAWNDFLTHPLIGNGVNVFAQKYTSPAGARDWISNFFLMTLHDTGIIGLVLVLGWLGWLAYETGRALKSARGAARTMLLALSIAYVALFVSYQAVTVFWLGFNWVYLGLIGAGTRLQEEG